MTIELVTTDGIFALDGGEWEVTNNIWIVGDEHEVVVVDAAHDHVPIVEAVAGRRVRAIVLTHGHNDHINAAVPLREAVDAPIWLHPADRMLWDAVWPHAEPDHGISARRQPDRRRPHPRRAAHTRALPWLLLSHRPGRWSNFHRRHPVLRWPGGDGSEPQRRADDPALDT